ncbi:hypothetical protein [Pseudobacteroides cellulosolvens]|uniref:Uncharacterized protein n=1 Tax=Pseudobacteroides cellulosolvens ATCC 35603 = DSM 2933 TaxID=398512 RepID=A0A0L6JNI3_9FIRM|nr:hypothetical protein [Pseudobacteroides cellulosolvens]KNY27368.1 hypothetical protein Bccel_2639 [Pseudobacteroides cellulosolvens ATCC 35603 = DSM 2933]
MRFVETEITELELRLFIKDIIRIYEMFFQPQGPKGVVFSDSDVDNIIASGDFEIIYKNIDSQLIEVGVYMKNELKERFTTTIMDEMATACAYMGTALFSRLNKTQISDVNFRDKKSTDIKFIKIDSLWKITIDIIMK